MPGSASSARACRRGRRRGRGRPRRRRAPGRGRSAPGRVTAASAGPRVEGGQRRRVGEEVGQLAVGPRDRRAERGDQPAGDGAGAGHGDLLAEHGADRDLVAVDVAGHPQAGTRGTSGPSTGSPPSTSSTATGSQSASSSRRTRSTPAVVSRRSSSANVASTNAVCPARRGRRSRAGPCRCRAGGRACGRTSPRRPSRRPARRGGRGSRAASRPAYGVRTASRIVTVPVEAVRAAPTSAQLGRRERVDLADRVVELPDAGEAGRERDVGELEVGRLDEHARGLRATGPGQGQRAGAELGGEQPAEVARRVADPRRPARRRPRGRRRRRRSAASPGRRRRRRRPSRGCRAWRRAGSACRRGSRPPGPRPRSGGTSRCGPPACGPGRTGGSRCRSCGPRCRRRRRSAGPATSRRGSRTPRSSRRVAVVMAPSCTPPPTVSGGNRTRVREEAARRFGRTAILAP